MKYDHAVYIRRKNKVVKKAMLEWNEQYCAYDSIRNKFDFDDRTISNLLKTHTVKEILEGEMTHEWFKPKEIYHLNGLICTIIVLLLLIYPIYKTNSFKAQELAIVSNFQ